MHLWVIIAGWLDAVRQRHLNRGSAGDHDIARHAALCVALDVRDGLVEDAAKNHRGLAGQSIQVALDLDRRGDVELGEGYACIVELFGEWASEGTGLARSLWLLQGLHCQPECCAGFLNGIDRVGKIA